MTPTLQQLGRLAGVVTTLYAGKARETYHARVLRDPYSRLRGPQGREDPYPVYAEIRARGGFVTTPLGRVATVDHATCEQVLRERRFGVRPEGATGPSATSGFDLSFLDRNPPDHTRLRRLAAPAFSPRRVASYRATIEATVIELLDEAAQQARADGGFDLVERLAAPLPIAVITRLLGIPDADTDRFARYGQVLGSAIAGVRSLAHLRALGRADAELDALFTELVELRRREPGDDLITDLVTAEAGAEVTAAEIKPLARLLLFAGFETTVNLLGNAVLALTTHPDQWALLRADPSLAGAATVETLRYDAPVQRTLRIAFDDTELGGHPVAAGEAVHLLIGGANRDPDRFADPDRFDITRTDAGHHLGFGAGIHHCVGRPLAELEATIALRVLAERMPALRRVGPVVQRDATLIRGPVRLPVAP